MLRLASSNRELPVRFHTKSSRSNRSNPVLSESRPSKRGTAPRSATQLLKLFHGAKRAGYVHLCELLLLEMICAERSLPEHELLVLEETVAAMGGVPQDNPEWQDAVRGQTRDKPLLWEWFAHFLLPITACATHMARKINVPRVVRLSRA